NFMLIRPSATLEDARAYQCRSACNYRESCPCWEDRENGGYQCHHERLRRVSPYTVIHDVVITEPARIKNGKNSSYLLAAGFRNKLPCEATGTRPVSITWYRNDGPIEEPRIAKGPEGHSRDVHHVHGGEDVTFSCNATGQPPPEFEWRQNNTIVYAGDRYLLGGNTFTILNVRPSDHAEYTCYARNLGGFDYVDYRLAVS
ncbi:Hemicentin-1, partial [Aphelenchoides avenae]